MFHSVMKIFLIMVLEFYNETKSMKMLDLCLKRALYLILKDSNSYLYLAKIYNIEDDQKKEEKNLETTLLIEPINEEAILMSMKIALKKSNYSKVKDLSKTFTKVCKKLCDDNKEILETLTNIEPKNNES